VLASIGFRMTTSYRLRTSTPCRMQTQFESAENVNWLAKDNNQAPRLLTLLTDSRKGGRFSKPTSPEKGRRPSCPARER
jgi:hypothetical protein